MASDAFRGSIGALAEAAGVHVETIRFYQRKGLLATPTSAPGVIRRYGPADVARVRFVKAAQRLGFTLRDIVELLALDAGTQCGTARGIAEGKLRDVGARLDEALARLGWPADYGLIDADTLLPSDPRVGYGTPTVLYGGRDLFGMPEPPAPHPSPT